MLPGMDHAREVDLIQSIHRDVHQLLERCSALTRAGDARPLLTLVGERLADQLRGVAELSGSLAALVSDEGRAAVSARRRGRRPGTSDVPPVAQAQTASSAPLVIRLKPRMPRGAWRPKGIRVPPERILVGAATPGAMPNEATEPSAASECERVVRLRKAGASEPHQEARRSGDGREALDRLREFLGGVSSDRRTIS